MGKAMRRGVNATGKSKKPESEQFVAIPYKMARSAAFRSLSGPALKVLIEVKSRYWGGNNGELSLSLDEASRLLRIGKATVARAFTELVAKGFLRMTRKGQWHGRRATEWLTTDKGHDGQAPTNEWRNWEPPKPIPDLSPSVN